MRAALAACLLLPGLLAGCGFRLQGALAMPAEMQRTYIQAADTHSLFYRELRRGLEAVGVEVVESSGDATAVLAVRIDETDQRVLSVSARNVPTEYEVYYTVQYDITSGQRILVPVQDVTLTRDYTYDSTLVLGKAHEEQLLRERIVRDLVRVVLEQASVK